MFLVHQKCFHAFFASNADMLSFVLEVFSANYFLRKSCKKRTATRCFTRAEKGKSVYEKGPKSKV